MRTIFLTLFCLAIVAVAHGQIRLDGGFAYGTDVNNPGVRFGSEIFVTEEISVNPGVIIYFEDAGMFDNRSWWEINANGHYYFAQESGWEFYGLAGINVTTRTIELGEARDPDTEVGLNLGIGVNYQWKDTLLPFGSFKYVASNLDQAVFSVGIRFVLRQ